MESTVHVQRKTTLPVLEAGEQKLLSRRKTILLVEDDEDLRCVMEHALRAMGYLVVACADAQFASHTFRSNFYIDILLTDFCMPGRTGIELARELTALCPSLPVIIITGSIPPIDIMQEMDGRRWTYVSKPTDLCALANALKRMISASSAAA